jgi:hypothetical protein
MQHNAQFRTPQFKDAKRPAAEHSDGYTRPFAIRDGGLPLWEVPALWL